MTVKELISALQKLDQNKQVYLSSDEEGNSYSTLDEQSINETNQAIILYPWEEGVDESLIFSDEDLGGSNA